MKQAIAEISQATLNLVFPVYCQSCNVKLLYTNRGYLCKDCLGKIKRNQPPLCTRCGRSLNTYNKNLKAICADCIGKSYSFKQAWQCCEYEGLTKELIHKFKYNKKVFLKEPLAEILCQFAMSYIDYKTIDNIIAVPMNKRDLQARGFNQAELLAEVLSKKLGIPYIKNLLIKTKRTKEQIGLNRGRRLKNLEGAFHTNKSICLNQKVLLLLDDVYTTGATANECSKTLLVSGAESIYSFAIARGK
ncbi:MAG: ComF family protein [Candidatus Omnitrophica bacterium]|nr:ComF family protein [Candidatus Omnitrophota bacterium]